MQPHRLDYYKLGHSNVTYSNVWEVDMLLVLLNYVECALVSTNGTPLSYKDALTDQNSTLWKKAFDEELQTY